ncbi:ABC transporter substrate-binding protein [Paenibacillus rigui]|uniref:ABC transporter substrate-binding protein n=1 Tax=Paenibacillus rigui TaxID=554312 RepID=A0A229UTQ6_9BACL|nr:sugar ABC transporter substrate-binding protein [Paenibacillus rigui]OXM86740.1 ABC transporter substrate-binding protein [Paenibacillus rigui]
MKWMKLLAVASGITLVLAGCGSGGGSQAGQGTSGGDAAASKPANGSDAASKDGKVTITFWDDNAGPNRTPFYQEMFKKFEQKYPNIHVEYVGVPQQSWKQKMDVAIASNDVPDVAAVANNFVSDFAAKGALLPVDSNFDKWDEKDKMIPSVINFIRSLSPDKKLYMLPNTLFMDLYWYRTDKIKDAGLNPPGTWDDFFKDVDKLTDANKNQFGYGLRGGTGSIDQLTRAMYAYSGITEYFDKNGKATVNDPKNIEFVKKFAALYKKNTAASDVANGYKEMVAEFNSGTAAIIQHNFGSYNDNLKALGDKFAGVLLPKSAITGKAVMVTNPNGYSVMKGTKHPDEAWKLLSFLASSDIQTYWNQNIGQMPTNQDSMNSDYAKNAKHIQDGAKILADKDTAILSVPVYLPDYASIVSQQLEPNLQKVLTGNMTVEDFANGWAKAMEKSYQDYNKALKK